MLLAGLLRFQRCMGADRSHLLAETFAFLLHLCCGNVLLAELMEIADSLVGSLFSVRQDGVGLLVGFPEDAVSRLVDFLVCMR